MTEQVSKEERFVKAEPLNLSTANVDMSASVSFAAERICIDDLDSFVYLTVAQARALREWLDKVIPS